jgi:hypothetical protein
MEKIVVDLYEQFKKSKEKIFIGIAGPPGN